MKIDNPLTIEIETLAKEIPTQIDKLHQDFNKFFGGADKKPPITMRDHLEKKVSRLQALMRQSTSPPLTFKAQGVVSKWNTYKALWDKKLMDREKK